MATTMRLYTSNASPFCLKIMVLLRELGIGPSVVQLDYSVKAFPTSPTTAHSHLAPLGKIPALALGTTGPGDETVLFGSQVIAQYLVDGVQGGRASQQALARPGTVERFEALTTEALADGICEAALALRYERLERPAELVWPEWVSGQLSKITRSVPVLSRRVATRIDPRAEVLPLDGIAAAIALYYVDRRAPDANWRALEGGRELEEWYRAVQLRDSWRETPFVQ
ncbi:hypothetical protein JCM11491_001014 [Sporobolomyces phaffii]